MRIAAFLHQRLRGAVRDVGARGGDFRGWIIDEHDGVYRCLRRRVGGHPAHADIRKPLLGLEVGVQVRGDGVFLDVVRLDRIELRRGERRVEDRTGGISVLVQHRLSVERVQRVQILLDVERHEALRVLSAAIAHEVWQ